VEVSRNELVEQELKHDYEKKAWNHQLETQKKNNLLIGLSGTLTATVPWRLVFISQQQAKATHRSL